MTIGRNLLWGIKYGLAIAGVTSIWASIIYLLDPKGVQERHHVGLPAIIAMYMACGLAGGGILGGLRPLAKWKTGQAVISFLIGAICGIAFRFGTQGFGPWTPWDSSASVFMGILAMVINWGSYKYSKRKRE